jgi:hypothetical protein
MRSEDLDMLWKQRMLELSIAQTRLLGELVDAIVTNSASAGEGYGKHLWKGSCETASEFLELMSRLSGRKP